MGLVRIVSGGQTEVDRGALDAALDSGFPCGGWCPVGRKAEDGSIPDRYPVVELPGAGYAQRTRRNVEDSDGTLILYFGDVVGGTLKTLRLCGHLRKPVLTIDATAMLPSEAARKTLDFIQREHIESLNVAGPRSSGAPEAHAYTQETVAGILRYCDGADSSN